MSRSRDERGTVTAFVAIFTIALIAMAGLVIDGGFILSTRQQAFDEADAAARAGAQAIDESSLRTPGPVRIDPAGAERRALDYLAAARMTGTVDVVGDAVTVHVTLTRGLTVLGFTGLGPVTIKAAGTAHAVLGVRTGGG